MRLSPGCQVGPPATGRRAAAQLPQSAKLHQLPSSRRKRYPSPPLHALAFPTSSPKSVLGALLLEVPARTCCDGRNRHLSLRGIAAALAMAQKAPKWDRTTRGSPLTCHSPASGTAAGSSTCPSGAGAISALSTGPTEGLDADMGRCDRRERINGSKVPIRAVNAAPLLSLLPQPVSLRRAAEHMQPGRHWPQEASKPCQLMHISVPALHLVCLQLFFGSNDVNTWPAVEAPVPTTAGNSRS